MTAPAFALPGAAGYGSFHTNHVVLAATISGVAFLFVLASISSLTSAHDTRWDESGI